MSFTISDGNFGWSGVTTVTFGRLMLSYRNEDLERWSQDGLDPALIERSIEEACGKAMEIWEMWDILSRTSLGLDPVLDFYVNHARGRASMRPKWTSSA